jgi:hypothetical protein
MGSQAAVGASSCGDRRLGRHGRGGHHHPPLLWLTGLLALLVGEEMEELGLVGSGSSRWRRGTTRPSLHLTDYREFFPPPVPFLNL